MATDASKLKLKRFYKTFAYIFAAMVLLVTILCIALPDRELSETENRSLAAFPKFTWERLISGQFTREFEEYVSDQMALRDGFVSLRIAYSEALGRDYSQGVYRGKDGYLIEKSEEPDGDKLMETIRLINAFAADYKVKTAFVLVPNASSVLSDKLPAFAINHDQTETATYIDMLLSGRVDFLWLYDELASLKTTSTQVYYRTDHHWTTQAAYSVLDEVCALLDKDSATNVTSETVTTDFVGSLAKKSGFKVKTPDAVTLIYPPLVSYTVTNMSTLCVSDSVFVRENATSADPYTVFLGGNASRINIKTDVADAGKLLVFKDSYFNCFLPLLLDKYSEIDIVDPRYYYDDINMLMLEKNYDQVLFFYNLNTFMEDGSLRLIFSDIPVPDPSEIEPEVTVPETTEAQTEPETTTEWAYPFETEPMEESSVEAETTEEETTVDPSKIIEEFISRYSEVLDGEIPDMGTEEIATLRASLSDTIFIGDSMAQMLLEYGYLDEAHVFYSRGANITQLGEVIQTAAQFNPKNVVFFTGLNDANHFQNGDNLQDYEDYAYAYLDLVTKLKSYLPNVKVYICSMLPPSEEFGATRPDLTRAMYFSIRLSQACESTDVTYIDTYWMVRQNCYLADGIHFNKAWTGVFARYIELIIQTAAGSPSPS